MARGEWKWREVSGNGEKRAEEARRGQKWREKGGSGENRAKVARRGGQKWREEVGRSGKKRAEVARWAFLSHCEPDIHRASRPADQGGERVNGWTVVLHLEPLNYGGS